MMNSFKVQTKHKVSSKNANYQHNHLSLLTFSQGFIIQYKSKNFKMSKKFCKTASFFFFFFCKPYCNNDTRENIWNKRTFDISTPGITHALETLWKCELRKNIDNPKEHMRDFVVEWLDNFFQIFAIIDYRTPLECTKSMCTQNFVTNHDDSPSCTKIKSK